MLICANLKLLRLTVSAKLKNSFPAETLAKTRFSTAYALLPGETEFVIVHDGVRPFVTGDIIDDSLGAAAQYGAAVVAVPVNDTIKVVDTNGFIVDTPVRSELWAVQTPQSFRKDLLFEAHQHARRAGRHATDDAALVEQLGFRVRVIAGSRRNLKITTQEDLIFAEALSTVQD